MYQHPWAWQAEHRGQKWTLGPETFGFITTPLLTCCVTLDLLFNSSKLWFICFAYAKGNPNPTGFLNGVNVIVHEKDLVHVGA